MKDKYFHFHGDGKTLDSQIVVKAKRENDATRIAKQEARDLKVGEPKLLYVSDSKSGPEVIYSWDGDY